MCSFTRLLLRDIQTISSINSPSGFWHPHRLRLRQCSSWMTQMWYIHDYNWDMLFLQFKILKMARNTFINHILPNSYKKKYQRTPRWSTTRWSIKLINYMSDLNNSNYFFLPWYDMYCPGFFIVIVPRFSCPPSGRPPSSWPLGGQTNFINTKIWFFAIFYFFNGIKKKTIENGLTVNFEDASFDIKHIGSKMALR